MGTPVRGGDPRIRGVSGEDEIPQCHHPDQVDYCEALRTPRRTDPSNAIHMIVKEYKKVGIMLSSHGLLRIPRRNDVRTHVNLVWFTILFVVGNLVLGLGGLSVGIAVPSSMTLIVFFVLRRRDGAR